MGSKNAFRNGLQKFTKEIFKKFTQEILKKVTKEILKKFTKEIFKKFTKEILKKFTKEILKKFTKEILKKFTIIGMVYRNTSTNSPDLVLSSKSVSVKKRVENMKNLQTT